MGNKTIIRSGDIQVMSAGTGVKHSEYNHSKDAKVKFLQIWVVPNTANVAPRYDQITLNEVDNKNRLQQIVSPNKDDDGVWIHQDAWFNLGNFDTDTDTNYRLKNDSNGVFVFLLEGNCSVNGEALNRRDAISVAQTEAVLLKMKKDSKVLLMEVPMSN